MQCFVYKGDKKDDHFLYLPYHFDGDAIPANLPLGLLEMLGELTLVIAFELEASRELPNADCEQVKATIESQGFYLQMPHDDIHATEDKFFN